MFNLGEIYVTVNIGHTKVKILCCEVRNGKTNILSKKTLSSEGMVENRIVIDKLGLSEQINRELKRISDFIQNDIKKVILLIPAKSLKVKKVKTKFELPSASTVITKSEIISLITSLKNFQVPSDKEIVDVIPFLFYVDGHLHTKPPIGETGKIIELEALVSSVDKDVYESHKETIIHSEVEILDVLIEPFCLACEISNKTQMDKGVFIINVSNTHTTVSKLRKEVLVSSTSIDAGLLYINKYISNKLNLESMQVERYKKSFVNLLNSEDLDTKIISTWSDKTNKIENITLKDLNDTTINAYEKLFDVVDFIIKKQTSEKPNVVINFNEDKIIGLDKWIIEHYNWNTQMYNPKIIGINNSSFASLLGASYYISQVNKTLGIKNYSTDPFLGNLEDINKHEQNMNTLWVEMFKWSQRLLPKH